MKCVDVSATCRRHLLLEMKGEVVCQEVACIQSRATIEGTLTNI